MEFIIIGKGTVYELFHFKEIPHVWQPSGWWLALFQIITCNLAMKGKVINQKRNTSVDRSFHASWRSWTVRIGVAMTVTIWSLSPWPVTSSQSLGSCKSGISPSFSDVSPRLLGTSLPTNLFHIPLGSEPVTDKSGAPLSSFLSLSSPCSRIIFFIVRNSHLSVFMC